MKRFPYNSKEGIRSNILEVYECIPYSFIKEHKDWYWKYNEWCQNLAKKIDLPLMPVCGVFVALSPQASIKQNKIFCEAYFNGFAKHTQQQISKANRITAMYGYLLEDEEIQKKQIETYLGGLKTVNFFKAIYDPTDKSACCLDRHAIAIAGLSYLSLKEKQYEFVKNCYLELADELNIIGSQLQCITWGYWRSCKHKHNSYN